MLPTLLLALLVLASAQADLEPISKNNMDFSHWDRVLKKHVTVNDTINGVHLNSFNYSALEGDWDFVNFTWQVENANVDGFDFNQYKAFWINVYNYLAVRLVYQNPCATDVFGDCRPIHSIREVGTEQPSFITAVWDYKELKIKSVNGTLSLNDIEDDRLRRPPHPWVEDARIHAAIVCASVSCPNLRDEAYEADPATLDAQLTDNAKNFLANPLKGAKVEGDSLRISAIFSFFPEDFANTSSKSYGPPSVQDYIKTNPDPTIFYFSYDWDLNGDVSALCTADRLCFPWWAFIIIGVSVVALSALFIVIYKRGKRRDYEVVN